VAIACACTLPAIVLWRVVLHSLLGFGSFRTRLQQRVLLIGWNREAIQLVDAIAGDRHHPYRVIGCLQARPQRPDEETRAGCPSLGSLSELEQVLVAHSVDVVIVSDLGLGMDSIAQVVEFCERRYVDFKIVPTLFRVFVSHLKLQSVSGIPVLGIENLEIATPASAFMKRAFDLLGSIVGLILSAPIIAILAVLIKLESPGPFIYGQTRTGRNGRSFRIYKMRSMRLDAEANGAQWATEADPRRTKIGAFMRSTNLDELPQFWNVFRGEMSLVGPRPERPELIARFETEIPHYNPRHTVRPGMTGWAQVNGLRGNTSLVERIKYDLYYIENWSIIFDVQIIILTFFKRSNAY
jgi:exopolysaccharide biosynthesis polyprenyl glycosylphosphotransferase